MGKSLELMESGPEVGDQVSVEKVFDEILRVAGNGAEVEIEIEKGNMIVIESNTVIEAVIGQESVIHLKTTIWKEREDTSVCTIMIEQGMVPWIEIEIKIEIGKIMTKNTIGILTGIGKDVVVLTLIGNGRWIEPMAMIILLNQKTQGNGMGKLPSLFLLLQMLLLNRLSISYFVNVCTINWLFK